MTEQPWYVCDWFEGFNDEPFYTHWPLWRSHNHGEPCERDQHRDPDQADPESKL
jgi:hypothetical protein